MDRKRQQHNQVINLTIQTQKSIHSGSSIKAILYAYDIEKNFERASRPEKPICINVRTDNYVKITLSQYLCERQLSI